MRYCRAFFGITQFVFIIAYKCQNVWQMKITAYPQLFECTTHVSVNWSSNNLSWVFAIYEDYIIAFLNEFALLEICWRGLPSQIFSIQTYLWASLFNSIWKQADWTKSNNLPALWKVKYRVYGGLFTIDYLIILAITNSILSTIRSCSAIDGNGNRSLCKAFEDKPWIPIPLPPISPMCLYKYKT